MRLLAGTVFDRPPRCERCNELESDCRCTPAEPSRQPPEAQSAQLAVEKRKGGRQVTVVRGLSHNDTDLADLLTRLRNLCGAGGTVRDGALEIQGSHLERIRGELLSIGYRVKAIRG